MPTNHDETLQDRYARELAAMDPKTPMVKVMASNWQEDSLAPTWQQLQQAVAEHDTLEQRNQELMQRIAELEAVRLNAQADIRTLIADDAHAMTFQSMGQYRSALLAALSAAPAAPQPAQRESEIWSMLPGHLIDNHEGEILTEELLQQAVAELCRITAQPAQQPLGAIESIHEWHRRACPEPDARALDVQMGCHFEELAEFVSCLAFRARGAAMALDGEVTELWRQLKLTAERLKSGEMSVTIIDRRGALDGLADGIVTSVGVGYRARMAITEALECVDASNWSKFVDGQPLYDANGKVVKGPNYQAPDLIGLFELEGGK